MITLGDSPRKEKWKLGVGLGLALSKKSEAFRGSSGPASCSPH